MVHELLASAISQPGKIKREKVPGFATLFTSNMEMYQNPKNYSHTHTQSMKANELSKDLEQRSTYKNQIYFHILVKLKEQVNTYSIKKNKVLRNVL